MAHKFTVLALLCLSLVTPTLQCNCTCSQSTSGVDVPKVTSPSPVSAPAANNSDCSSIVYSMMDCLSYLLVDSTDVTPTKACCDGLQSVLDYNPHCVCVALSGSHDMGFDLNTTRALASPIACSISKTNLACEAGSPPVTPSPPPASPVTPPPPVVSPVKPSPPPASPVTPPPPVVSPVKPSPPPASPVTPPPPVVPPVKPSPPPASPVTPPPPVVSPVKPSPPPASPATPSPPVASPVAPSPPVASPVKPSPTPVVPPVKPSPVIAPSQPPVKPSPAPVPSSNSDCSTVVYNMMDCLSFLTPGSLDLKPSKSCCDGIESVVDYNPQCFCVGLEGSRDMGLDINNTRAYNMPSICHIAIDPHCEKPVAATPKSPVLPNPPTTSPSSPKSPISSPKAPVSSAKAPAQQTETAPAPSVSGAMDLAVSKSFLAMVLFSFVFILV